MTVLPYIYMGAECPPTNVVIEVVAQNLNPDAGVTVKSAPMHKWLLKCDL